MKRLAPVFLLVPALGLAACHRAPESAPNPPPPTNAPAAAPMTFAPDNHATIESGSVPLLEQINRENIRVASVCLPSVVRIAATLPEQTEDPHARLFGHEMPFPFHFSPHNNRGFDAGDTAYGSGIVLSRDGYIVTNRHVIADAQNLQVDIPNKGAYAARVIASDELTDLAVLKIEVQDLSPIAWGDSDHLQVGEQVFAIGNPFNLEDSLSKGIVSAKGRNLPNTREYEDYIQTDAEINPGNSGGALVDIHGRLVGVNVAIASSNGVYMGVGFAIPSNLVRYTVQGLLKQGRLVRGYLGVRLPALVDSGVISQLGIEGEHGALLAGVQSQSPADVAKLRAVDFITEIDGRKIASVEELRLVVAQLEVGSRVQVKFIRDGKHQEATLQIGEIPKDRMPAMEMNPPEAEDPVKKASFPKLDPANALSGLQVTELTAEARSKYRVADWVNNGVVVSAVQEGSAAEARGFRVGSVIQLVSVRKGLVQPVDKPQDLADVARQLKPGDGAMLLVDQYGQDGYAGNFIYLAPGR